MYKKGLKSADAILRKSPDNGETLAMKGLLLNCLDRKEEAYDYVKRGVKANLRSHVCWHVYGLLYRSDRDYDEAIKCYKNALRMDKDNITILRDLTQLQIQLRDISGFLESRQLLLNLKPTHRQSWVGLALAHHLSGNYDVAATAIETLEGTIDLEEIKKKADEKYEHGELLLYKALILEEGQKFADALAALDAAEKYGLIVDKLAALEARGRLLLSLGWFEEAEGVYRRLLHINQENYAYHDGLLSALRGQGATVDAVVAVFEALQEKYPHSVAVRRRPLDVLSGDDPAFEVAVDAFVRRYLARGIPSLFSEFKPLYDTPAKATALGKVMHRMEDELQTSGTFPEPLEPPKPHHHLPPADPPHSLMWTRFYLSLHYDRLGDTGKAVEYIDQCISESPSTPDLYSARAKILKHGGDVRGAAVAAETARTMVLSDRYLNCLATKALFRADRVEEAEKVVTLFTREGEQANNLYDMQATWYEIASGRAYLARKDYGRALKRFLKVDAHFSDFVDDQVDFHQYCLRKQTMRAYVEMLRMEDGIYRHPVYLKAAGGAIQAYIELFDDPQGTPEEREAAKIASMSPEEAKKYVQKKKKEEAKKAKEAAAAAAAATAAAAGGGNAKAKSGEGNNKKVDSDPDGVKLASTKDPLGEATKLIVRLEKAHGGNSSQVDVQLWAFQVYLRKQRYLMALRAVKKAVGAETGAEDPRVHVAIVQLAKKVEEAGAGVGASASAVVRQVLSDGIASLLQGASNTAEYHAAWVAKHQASTVVFRWVVAQGSVVTAPHNKHQAAMELARPAIDGKTVNTKGNTHAECVAVHKWLLGQGEGEAAGVFTNTCAAVFEWSRYFGGAKCVSLSAEDSITESNGIEKDVAALNVG